MKIIIIFFFFVFFFSVTVSLAQQQSDQQFDKNPIIISPNKNLIFQNLNEANSDDIRTTDFVPEEATQSSYVIQYNESNNNPAQINWSLLPGVDIDNSSVGQRQGIQIRASSEEEVNVFWQGVPLGAGLSLPNDLNILTTATSNQVRLYHGVTPIHLGLPSSAGVLELSLRPSVSTSISSYLKNPKFNSQIYGQVDQWGDWRTIATHSSKKNKLALKASLAQGEGARPFLMDAGTPLISSDDRQEIYQHNGYQQISLALVANPIPEKDVQFSFLHMGSDNQIPNATNSSEAQSDRSRKLNVAVLDSQYSVASNQKITFHLDGSQSRELFNDPQGEWGQAGQWSTQISQFGFGSTWQLAIDRWLIHSSLHWRQASLLREEVLPSIETDNKKWRRTIPSGHMQLKYFLSNIVIESNHRLILVTDRAYQGILEVREQTDSEHNFGMRWNLNGNHALISSWQQTLHIPALEDYFGNPGLLRSNPELVSETLQTLEVGHELNYRQWQMHTSIFQRRIEDPIALRSDAFGQRQRINWNRAKINGLEWRLSTPWGKYVVLSSAHTFQNARGQELLGDSYRELPGKYRWLSAFQAQLNLVQWTLGPQLTLKREGLQDRDGLLIRENYTDVTLFAQWHPLKAWSGHLGIRANNLMNRRSATSRDIGPEGRKLMLDASVNY